MAPRPRTAVAAERPTDDTRERIIDAAQAIFARDGFIGAKMQEISDRVGIQRPSLFYHFKNKEALFVAAHERVFARIEPVFRESFAVSVDHNDPFAQLDRVSRGVLKVLGEQPDVARMVARTSVDRHPAAVKIVRTYLQPLIDLSVEFVREGQRRGVFADIDPFFFTLNSWGAALIYFIARDLLAPNAKPTDPKDVARFTTTLLQMGNRALAIGDRRVAQRASG
jgi:TetR/AcrR family transcriptional regulator